MTLGFLSFLEGSRNERKSKNSGIAAAFPCFIQFPQRSNDPALRAVVRSTSEAPPAKVGRYVAPFRTYLADLPYPEGSTRLGCGGLTVWIGLYVRSLKTSMGASHCGELLDTAPDGSIAMSLRALTQ